MKIKLKPIETFETTLEYNSEFDMKHTDFIAPSEYIIENLGKEIEVTVLTEKVLNDLIAEDSAEADQITSLKYLLNNTLVFCTENGDVIHYSWVSNINKEVALTKIEPTNMYVKVTRNFLIEKSTGIVHNKADIRICPNCGEYLDVEGEELCSSCISKKYFNLHNYSYKPTPSFIGKQVGKHAKLNPVWYGLELEYGLTTQLQMALLVKNHSNEVYIKSDSSITGGNYKAELVSHPCSFDHLMSNKSWLNAIEALDAVSNPETNGCHIHVSRTAFKDNKHYAKFKFLLQSNIALIELIGGRQLNSYCKMVSDKRTIHKTDKDLIAGDKYTVCNEQHKDTIELRFMASSKNVADVKRYIQYVDALIKYTAYHSATANYKGFYAYVVKYSSVYKEIHSILEANIDKVVGEVKYKTPKIIRAAFDTVKPKDYANLVKIYIDNIPHSLEDRTITLEFSTTTGKVAYISGYTVPDNATLDVEYIKGV